MSPTARGFPRRTDSHMVGKCEWTVAWSPGRQVRYARQQDGQEQVVRMLVCRQSTNGPWRRSIGQRSGVGMVESVAVGARHEGTRYGKSDGRQLTGAP